jgi:hypothetical protein
MIFFLVNQKPTGISTIMVETEITNQMLTPTTTDLQVQGEAKRLAQVKKISVKPFSLYVKNCQQDRFNK